MYGSTQEEIIRDLGEPEEIVKKDGSTHFIYQWKRSDKDIVFLVYRYRLGGRSNIHLYCLFLEFDENDHLNRHKSVERLVEPAHEL